MNMQRMIHVLCVFALVMGSVMMIETSDAESKTNQLDAGLDLGVGNPCSITGGMVCAVGDESIGISVGNLGGEPATVGVELLIESLDGFTWQEEEVEYTGPYDLDPDVWVESFFDVCYEAEGEYRATFSLVTPVSHELWADDNPDNDAHQIVYSARRNGGESVRYVDDDADPGGDGSATAPYQTITDALDQVTQGGCIMVNSGIYQENLVIDTPSVTLRSDGDNPDLMNSVIDGGGNGNVITITADWVTVSGFTIKNSGGNEEDAALDITSDHCMVSWNTLEDNGATGIYLHDHASSNYIHHNIIRNNDGAGIFIWEQSLNNHIYHNDFMRNEWYHVKDKEGGNHWNHDHPWGGNYWDDYRGMDTNGDGIGEGAYDIMGDVSIMGSDQYPWVTPHGWNNDPKTPVITGITEGVTGESYTYNLTIGDEHFEPGSEPFEEHVYCRLNWGDDQEEFIGPISLSNLNDIGITVHHQWDADDSYLIRAQLVDAYGMESDWGQLQVSMPKQKTMPFLVWIWLENHPLLWSIIETWFLA